MNNPSRPRFRSGVLAFGFSCLLLGGTSASAAESKEAPEVTHKKETPEFRFDFGLFGGAHFFNKGNPLGHRPGDEEVTDPPNPDNSRVGVSLKTAGTFGGRLGFHFNKWIGLEAEVNAVPTKTKATALQPATSSVWVFGYRGSLILNLTDSYEFQPFILAGYGGLTTLPQDSEKMRGDTWGFLHAGLGFKIGFTPWTGLRVDGRIMAPWTALSPVLPQGNRVGYDGPDWEALGSLYINFGQVEKAVTILQPSSKDRDGDGIPDTADRCPDQPEDRDGFQDEDGCADLDNDNDGIPDGLDKCPNEPEDKDGFEDTDGCPDIDNDGDGVQDARDKCPNEPEDKDGFQDEDGCPDPDNDGDGIPDTRDKCPNEAETFNNYKDDDGCPDEIPAAVKKFTGVIEGINFKTGSAEILAGSYAILDRAIKVLQDYPDVNLEISGHTDNRGKAEYNRNLSQRRADSVKTYFIQRGIASSRLQSIGYGPTRPIADNKSQSGRATNRRTEFRLINVGGETK